MANQKISPSIPGLTTKVVLLLESLVLAQQSNEFLMPVVAAIYSAFLIYKMNLATDYTD